MSHDPIGIFDSGIGGTTIWRELQALMPYEDMIYLADSRNAPYGEKSREAIIELCVKNTEYLLGRSCKLVVVACNTATTNAIDYLRANYDIPFIGIEPAIKPAALQTGSRKVGVLATKGTLASSLFLSTSRTHASGIEVMEKEGEGLVRLIEEGEINSPRIRELLIKFTQPMVDAHIDHLVLGCTHYPYLIPVLKQILPKGVAIIDCGQAVARQTQRVLARHGLQKVDEKAGKHQFYSNSNPAILKKFLQGEEVSYSVEFLEF